MLRWPKRQQTHHMLNSKGLDVFPLHLRHTRRTALLAAVLLVILSSVSACGMPSTTNDAAAALGSPAPNPLSTALPASPDPADPTAELVIVGQQIAAGLDPVHELTSAYLRAVGAGEGLLKVAADGTVVPELAQSVTQIEPRTWEVRLRPGIRFWSGTPVDAAAVHASLERSRALDPQAAPFLADVTIEVVDPTTLRLVTGAPNPNLPLNLSYYQLLIHNAASYGDRPNPFDLAAMDLTGMYRVVTFTPKQAMSLERNPDYWGVAPQIARVRHEEVADGQGRVLAAQSGQAQIVTHLPVESAATLEGSPALRLISIPAANTTAVYLNLASPILRDVRVRQALGWSVDRQALVELAREGFSQPASSWLSTNPAYPEAAQQGFTLFDPAKASALLEAAGWTLDNGVRTKDGQRLTIRMLTFGAEKAVGEVLQSQWAQLGVALEVEHADDYALIQARRDAGDWDTLIEAWSTFGDPQALLAGQLQPGGKANYGGYDDAETNALFDRLARATDEAERRQLILAINARACEQVPVIPLHPRPQISAVSSRVQQFQPHFRQFEALVTAALSMTR